MNTLTKCSIIALLAATAVACTKAPEDKAEQSAQEAPTEQAIEAAEEVVEEAAAEEAEDPGLPMSDIYLLSVTWDEGGIALGAPKNISQKPLYDNQPFFIPGTHEFYYSSMADNGKTDIWHYDAKTAEHSQVTKTSEKSEYSPQLTPVSGKLSVIQENEDAGGQKVYRYNLDGTDGAPAMDLNPVGYYAWNAEEDKLVVFALGDPHTLRHVDLMTGEITVVYENIDRALYALPDSTGAVFTAPNENEGFSAFKVDFESVEATPLFDLPGSAQDYLVFAKKDDLSKPTFWAIHDNKLHQRDLSSDTWTQIADLSGYDLSGATRMAISDDHQWLAIVADPAHQD